MDRLNSRLPTDRRRNLVKKCTAATALAIIGVAAAPMAVADTTDNTLRAAVAAAPRSSCPPLRPVPVIDHAAKDINNTTDRWLNFAARAVPETNALPVLKDLGYSGSKAKILSAAAASPQDSIKAALLQGFAELPDCSYKDFGASSTYNARKKMVLVTVVLAG